MQNILVLGAGKIGSLIATLLANSHDYHIFLIDNQTEMHPLKDYFQSLASLTLTELDAQDLTTLAQFIQKNKIIAVASCLPYYCNIPIIKLAKELNLHYFDLTEDTQTAAVAAHSAQAAKTAFVPQCGLAPGVISIITDHLAKNFPTLDTIKMRVGALPLNISNALLYSLTWSIDGLINEYGNPCEAINQGQRVTLLPLDGLEKIKIDGLTYEAFNTSGGIGTLVDTYQGRVKNLNYKTIRYPGHCAKMRFLMNDLALNDDRKTLKRILENVIPKTGQDVVLVYVSVTGKKDQHYYEKNYVKKFYPKIINEHEWSAIQLTTAFALCAILDIVISHTENYRGLIRQEQFSFNDLIANRFGNYFS